MYTHLVVLPLTILPDGDHDWMDPQGGSESVEKLRQAGNGHGRMYIVPHAGHHCECGSHNARADSDLKISIHR